MFDLADRREELRQLEQRMSRPGFWDDPEQARSVIDRSNELKEWVEPWDEAADTLDEMEELAVLLEDEEDAELRTEIDDELQTVKETLDRLELKSMLRGEDTHRNAILTVHPGAGGTESQDWAEMLTRMYTRWAERRGFEVEVLDLVPAEEAGIKSAALEVKGRYAYGYLAAERGVHRLVRISPFDSEGRRHTSFASVFVYPRIDDDIEVEINEEDLRVDTYRASGAGGQHVNKTDSAVRITHEPTGVVVSCQQERSQHKNRRTAMKMLRAELYQKKKEEREQERQELEAKKSDISFGSQIRSYVLHPYTMVKDHRTDVETGDVDAALDGEIDEFIEAYLKEQGSEAGD
ncbi:MAG: peptide chain release factor 2 [Candidatus Palauibacterales bacterium]|nr:peptide chain release factor 2 [Candidatus Palauibacterales bacterium]